VKNVIKKNDEELFQAIDEAILKNTYFFTHHAEKRSVERKNVSDLQVVKSLKDLRRYHEKRKDSFDERFNTWNYSVRSLTVDDEKVRVIISFSDKDLLIITVINLEN
jgi:hypothetical protein